MLRPAKLIAFRARIEPNKPAIVSGDSVVSYGMLEHAARAVAHRVAGFGLSPGSIVALSIEAPGRHLAVSLALERCGLVSAGFDSQQMLAALPPVALVLTDKPFLAPDGGPAVVVDDSWFGVLPPDGAALPEPGPEDAYRMFAFPGAGPITYTQASATARAAESASALDMIGAFERALQLFGLVTAAGYIGTLAALARGKTVYFPAAKQDPLQLVQVYQCQIIQCTAAQLGAMLARQQQRYLPLPSLIGIAVEGALAGEMLSAARSLIAGRLLTTWGVPQLPIVSAELVGHQDAVAGAVGYLCPWAEGRAVDGTGQALPAGKPGALQVQSKAEGAPWLDTGARGTITPAGRLLLSGDNHEVRS